MDLGSRGLYQKISEGVLDQPLDQMVVVGLGMNSPELAAVMAERETEKTFLKKMVLVITNGKLDHEIIKENFKEDQRFCDHTGEINKDKRRKNYQQHIIFLMDHRKLIIDLLEDLIDVHKISRVIIENIYTCPRYHPLAVSVNIIKRLNPETKIMAILNDPQRALINGKYRALMENLDLRHCDLWPINRPEISKVFQQELTLSYKNMEGDPLSSVAEEENIVEKFLARKTDKYLDKVISRAVADNPETLASLNSPGPKIDENIANNLVISTGYRMNALRYYEIFVPEKGGVAKQQNTLLRIMKGCYDRLRSLYKSTFGEEFTVGFNEIVDMPIFEFEIKVGTVKNRGHFNDLIFDLQNLRNLLFSFNSPLRTRTITHVATYKKALHTMRHYKGIHEFGNYEREQFDEMVTELEGELYETRFGTQMPKKHQLTMIDYIGNQLKLPFKYADFKSSLLLTVKRKPKLRALLNELKSIGDANKKAKKEKPENVLVVCCNGRREELNYLIASYFNCNFTEHSMIELKHLHQWLNSISKIKERMAGLQSNNREIYERAILEQRLSDEIHMLLDYSKDIFRHQLFSERIGDFVDSENMGMDDITCDNPGYDEDDENKPKAEVNLDLNNQEEEQNQARKQQNEFDQLIPAFLEKLIVLPHDVASDCLRMCNISDYDENGYFKMKHQIYPGINLRVVDFTLYFSHVYNINKNYKPSTIILLDQNPFLVRRLQINNILSTPVEVRVMVGEDYLEGWLYRARDKKEERIFKTIRDYFELNERRPDDRMNFDFARMSKLEMEQQGLLPCAGFEDDVQTSLALKLDSAPAPAPAPTAKYLGAVVNEEDLIRLNHRSVFNPGDDTEGGRTKKPVRQTAGQVAAEAERNLMRVSRLNEAGPTILVDKREFNSETPGLLYFSGYNIVPLFLKSGDYILSNQIAIERKAADDFKMSIKTRKDRLTTQVKGMLSVFSQSFTMIELYKRETLFDMNVWLNNWMVASNIPVYKATAKTDDFPMNFALLCTMFMMSQPLIQFLYCMEEKDAIAYMTNLKSRAGPLNVEQFQQYSRRFENITGALIYRQTRWAETDDSNRLDF